MRHVSIALIRHPEHPDLILHLRRKEGTWCCPGGGVEENETPGQGLLRELQEEIGLKPEEILECKSLLDTVENKVGGDIALHLFEVKIPSDKKFDLSQDPDQEGDALMWLDPMNTTRPMHIPASQNIVVRWLGGPVEDNQDLLGKSELMKRDYYELGLPQGWIAPTGEFHEMESDDDHREVAHGLLGLPPPEGDDDESGILHAYDNGWVSVGHAGEHNIQGSPQTLKNPRNKQMSTARLISQGIMNDYPGESHISINSVDSKNPLKIFNAPTDHFVRHGTLKPEHAQKSELMKTPAPLDDPESIDWESRTPDSFHGHIDLKNVQTKQLGPNLYHHVAPMGRGKVIGDTAHFLSTHGDVNDPFGYLIAEKRSYGTHQAVESGMDKHMRGKGMGHRLYLEALKHHGELESDDLTSPGSNSVWKKLLNTPGVEGRYDNGGLATHVAKWVGNQKLAASELAKMSQPTIRFPKVKNLPTRPDQDVQLIEKPRDKEIHGRKVFNEEYSQPIVSGHLKRIAPHYMPGSQSFANEAAKLGLKPNDMDMDQSRQVMDQIARNKFDQAKEKAIKAYKSKMGRVAGAAFLPEKSSRRGGKPLPYVMGGKYSKKDVAGKTDTDTHKTIEHEAVHSILHELRNKYGNAAYHKTIQHLLSHIPASTRNRVEDFIVGRGYKRRDSHFPEEVLTHARDILVTPQHRSSLERMIGNPEEYKQHMGALKSSWKKIHQASQNLTPEQLHDWAAAYKSELTKGETIKMPKKDVIKEHKKLINTLEHPTKAKLEAEDKEQSKELKGYLAKDALGDKGILAGRPVAVAKKPQETFEDKAKRVIGEAAQAKTSKQSPASLYSVGLPRKNKAGEIVSNDKTLGSLKNHKPGIFSFGGHWPVLRPIHDNIFALHTNTFGSGKTADLINSLRNELATEHPDLKIVDVHHPDYRMSAKVMHGSPTDILSHLKEASEKHPDPEKRLKALQDYHTLNEGLKVQKSTKDKRMAGFGWDTSENEQKRLDRMNKLASKYGLTLTYGNREQGKKAMGLTGQNELTTTAGDSPHSHQIQHELAHALQTPVGFSLREYQNAIGMPGPTRGGQDQNATKGLDPETQAWFAEAGIAHRAGLDPFRVPPIANPGTKMERTKQAAAAKQKLMDLGMHTFNPQTGVKERRDDVNATINARDIMKQPNQEPELVDEAQQILEQKKQKNKVPF